VIIGSTRFELRLTHMEQRTCVMSRMRDAMSCTASNVFMEVITVQDIRLTLLDTINRVEHTI